MALGLGVNVAIEGVVIPADLLPEVTFSVTDDLGTTIGLDQFVGSREIRFVLAYLEGSGDAKTTPTGQFTSYVPAAGEEGNATYDHNLTDGLTENEDGTISYKFETAVPEDYDRTATHQLGSQYRRTHPITGERYEANNIYRFRPDGAAVTETREIVATEACNECHTKLTMHGRRREIQYCILCHQPQTPEANFPEMIHKIHMGANLPSVQAGTPYGIGRHDFSGIHFPQEVNNCVVCHTDAVDGDGNPVAPHADVWMNNPGAVACGACHDDVDFETGENHIGGPQLDDSMCNLCHPAASIEGYHIKDYAKLVLAATADDISVDGTGLVTFTFSASDTEGNAILDLDDDEKYRVGYLIGWPAEEYEENVGNSHVERAMTNNGDGTYSYTAEAGEEIPVGTAESFGFVFRGRSMIDANGDVADGNETRVPMEKVDPIFFRTDGGDADSRREIVDDEACAKCHGAPFAGHGEDRVGAGVCVFCHNVTLNSTPDEGDTVTVNFKNMIHSIHRGSDLENGYTTGGHGGDVDFTEIHFPGRLEQCSICHGDHDVSVPLSSQALPTITSVDDDDDELTPDVVTVTQPITAACTSCHDGVLPMTHAILATDPDSDVETCAVCHGSGAEFDVEEVHNLGPASTIVIANE